MIFEALIDEATEEISSQFSQHDIIELALRLDIPFGEAGDYVTDRNGTMSLAQPSNIAELPIKDVVRRALASPPRGDSQDESEIDRLAGIRIFFETFMLWSIVDRKGDLHGMIQDLSRIQAELDELSQATPFSDSSADKAWRLDGEFHRVLCVYSDCKGLAKVVDKVIDECAEWGRPQSEKDVKITWREHNEIIDKVECGDVWAIYEAIDHHVRSAAKRWMARERLMNENDDWGRSAVAFLEARASSKSVEESEPAFLRELPDLLESHQGEWVAFQGGTRLAFGKSKPVVLQRCTKSGYRAEDLVIRKIVPQLALDRIDAS